MKDLEDCTLRELQRQQEELRFLSETLAVSIRWEEEWIRLSQSDEQKAIHEYTLHKLQYVKNYLDNNCMV